MQHLTQLQAAFKAYAATQSYPPCPSELSQPIQYILALGGKAIRPTLVLAACQLFSPDINTALPAAYAVELFHNFSLMHDDIMDAAPTRRGKPTVHHQYDENTAILSGDAMLVLAYQYLAKMAPDRLAPALEAFNRMAWGVCAGQRYDMNFETQQAVSIADYLKMIELKTAVLLQACLEIGALAGGADTETANRLGLFGLYTGIAFQLQDDYLDTFGDPLQFGKRIGGDIVQNKKTYLYLKALALAQDQPELLQMLLQWATLPTTDTASEEQKIRMVTDIFTRLHIPDYLKSIIADYHQKAMAVLHSLEHLPQDALAVLGGFADQLLERAV